MDAGWIKLHRSLLSGDSTFQRLTAIQQAIAIHLLLRASYKDTAWYDRHRNIEVSIRRGQLVTSRNSIKEWFHGDRKVTDRVIRTALDKLQKLNFIAIETTKTYTLITVVNYSKFQNVNLDNDQEKDQQMTNRRPKSGQETATSKEWERKDKKKGSKNLKVVL